LYFVDKNYRKRLICRTGTEHVMLYISRPYKQCRRSTPRPLLCTTVQWQFSFISCATVTPSVKSTVTSSPKGKQRNLRTLYDGKFRRFRRNEARLAYTGVLQSLIALCRGYMW